MQKNDELKKLASKFSDRSRKVAVLGKTALVPHKFTPDGEVINDSNFDVHRDLSRLTLDDFRLLEALQIEKWNFQRACQKVNQPEEKALKRYKKLRYFEFEASKANALAAIATPSLVASKQIENLYADNLSDGQRDSLK